MPDDYDPRKAEEARRAYIERAKNAYYEKTKSDPAFKDHRPYRHKRQAFNELLGQILSGKESPGKDEWNPDIWSGEDRFTQQKQYSAYGLRTPLFITPEGTEWLYNVVNEPSMSNVYAANLQKREAYNPRIRSMYIRKWSQILLNSSRNKSPMSVEIFLHSAGRGENRQDYLREANAFIGDLYEEGYISFHQELGTWEETSGYSI